MKKQKTVFFLLTNIKSLGQNIIKIGPLTFILLLNLFAANAQCNFKTIGHRGGSSYYFPENTLIALEHGFTEGIYAAEVDVRFTADSIMVLMHDRYIDRTTNGTGNVEDLSMSYLKTVDAGSWKNKEFAETQVPTLNEALQLAKKYGKKLYLNMKIFAPELVAKTIGEAGVEEDIILLDPDNLDKVIEYHIILPKTPLVYFGELPDDINDSEFFELLKNNGVIAIEVPADYIYNDKSDRYEKLRDIAHSYGLELWAYTVNDPAYFAFLKDFGIDGLETDRPSEASQFFCNNSNGGFFPGKQITGQWDFNFSLDGT
ncbi:MAG TPA: glycerophosphodiester phosphodiesterase family protein, partial [Draconibacterium sp.]|nr:glycerophosphodiester phosphodiesterase family protein [Draconibacterium sp.]